MATSIRTVLIVSSVTELPPTSASGDRLSRFVLAVQTPKSLPLACPSMIAIQALAEIDSIAAISPGRPIFHMACPRGTTGLVGRR